MPLFKASRHPGLVGIAIVLFLCFSIAPRESALIHQELGADKEPFNRHDNKAVYEKYRTGERVASDAYVNWDGGLVPEAEITSHVPGLSLQRLPRPESTDLLVTRLLRNTIPAGRQWHVLCRVGPSKSTTRVAIRVVGLERY
jgi:hypothetical protein